MISKHFLCHVIYEVLVLEFNCDLTRISLRIYALRYKPLLIKLTYINLPDNAKEGI